MRIIINDGPDSVINLFKKAKIALSSLSSLKNYKCALGSIETTFQKDELVSIFVKSDTKAVELHANGTVLIETTQIHRLTDWSSLNIEEIVLSFIKRIVAAITNDDLQRRTLIPMVPKAVPHIGKGSKLLESWVSEGIDWEGKRIPTAPWKVTHESTNLLGICNLPNNGVYNRDKELISDKAKLLCIYVQPYVSNVALSQGPYMIPVDSKNYSMSFSVKEGEDDKVIQFDFPAELECYLSVDEFIGKAGEGVWINFKPNLHIDVDKIDGKMQSSSDIVQISTIAYEDGITRELNNLNWIDRFEASLKHCYSFRVVGFDLDLKCYID